MPHVHYRLLMSLGAIGLLCASCAMTASSAAMSSGSQPDAEELSIDLTAGRATTVRWSSEIVDCSDREYFCLRIPNKMVLAFVRSCGNLIGRNSFPTRLGNIVAVAPAPHLAPPSGGYVISSFPNVLLYYNTNFGLNEVRILRHSPYDRDFDPNDYSERYAIRTSAGPALFMCSQ
jgi:hypothetical protein